MYLQVECDNTAALRLYERSGFTELCRYHYRTLAASQLP
jgi:ribosomal protein S18 acetylase RimI-like enzyme